MRQPRSGYGVDSFTSNQDPTSLNVPGTSSLRKPRLANNTVKKPKLYKGFKDVQKSMSKRLRTI